jgi:hypothetical protein
MSTDVIAEATAAMLARWEPLAVRGQPVKLAAAQRELTQGIMQRVLFGPDIRPSTKPQDSPSCNVAEAQGRAYDRI